LLREGGDPALLKEYESSLVDVEAALQATWSSTVGTNVCRPNGPVQATWSRFCVWVQMCAGHMVQFLCVGANVCRPRGPLQATWSSFCVCGYKCVQATWSSTVGANVCRPRGPARWVQMCAGYVVQCRPRGPVQATWSSFSVWVQMCASHVVQHGGCKCVLWMLWVFAITIALKAGYCGQLHIWYCPPTLLMCCTVALQ